MNSVGLGEQVKVQRRRGGVARRKWTVCVKIKVVNGPDIC